MFEEMTYEKIKGDILQEIKGIEKREGSFVNDMVSPIAYQLEGAYAQFDKMLGVMFVADSAGAYIDKRGGEYGIQRKDGTFSEGSCTFSGTKNAAIPKGSLCATPQGLLFETKVAGKIGEEGKAVLPIRATETGDRHNILAEEINTLPVTINGVTGVVNGEKLLGGAGEETDEALAKRILLRLQAPPTSGNAAHYRLWAMEVDGVGDAKIFPLDKGAGTVTVLPITAEKRSTGTDILEQVQKKIEAQRPIGATVTVTAPTEVMINIVAVLSIAASTSWGIVKEAYTAAFTSYIKNGVFRLNAVDYLKCVSIFYEIEGVIQVKSLSLNGGSQSISLGEKQIQVAGAVGISGTVI